jgi:ATP-dependent DNA helicase DinG
VTVTPTPAGATTEALKTALAAKDGAVDRPGQRAMAEAVAAAIAHGRHLMVQAGTGTGKSLAYLVPPLVAGKRVVVSTATKTLQDQLAGAELPFLAGTLEIPVTWAVLKGRQSYACMARLVERFGEDLDGSGAAAALFDEPAGDEARRVAAWAAGPVSGDRDDLPAAVPDGVWRELSVSGMECPGAARCPQGGRCFAEAALERARDAAVVVTNHHLYGLHLVSGKRILPEHDVVVFDEAHRLESALTSAFGVDVTPGRLVSLAGNARHVVGPAGRRDGIDPLEACRAAAGDLERELGRLDPGRVDPGNGELGAAIGRGIAAATAVGRAIRPAEGAPESLRGLIERVKRQAGHLAGDFQLAFDLPGDRVAWIEEHRRALRVAPVEVAGALASHLLGSTPAVFTSATLTVGTSFAPLARRLGLEPVPEGAAGVDTLAVPGSFDYPSQALLYIASALPDPRSPDFEAAALAEVAVLVEAALGRALVLTTSYRMMEAAAARLDGSPWPVLVQGSLPKKRLIARFAAEESATLVATMGYWEGIDVPGPSLSLVVIDKLPFPRPDDPPVQARREAVAARGGDPFEEVDLPQATMLLAQGAGRLIRSESDRGVVAVLDNRLTAKRYGRRVIRSLPPFARTSDRERAVRFLRDLP